MFTRFGGLSDARVKAQITRGERTAKWNEATRIAEQLRGGGTIRPLRRPR